MKEAKKIHKVLVTAGPTREPIDPVRFLSNRSTGEMGYRIASESAKRGHQVCLVTGPVNITPPEGIEVVNVMTALEMRDEVLKRTAESDCIIMAAAVCDYRPETASTQKIKKSGSLNVNFVKNPDILGELMGKEDLVKVGFALETENATENGISKLKAKNLDLIVINTVGEGSDPFGGGSVDYTMITRLEKTKSFTSITKEVLAREILDEVESLA